VVGLPTSWDASEGPQARRSRRFAQSLANEAALLRYAVLSLRAAIPSLSALPPLRAAISAPFWSWKGGPREMQPVASCPQKLLSNVGCEVLLPNSCSCDSTVRHLLACLWMYRGRLRVYLQDEYNTTRDALDLMLQRYATHTR